MQTKQFFIWVTCVTIAFCLAIGFDVTPYLRGPAPYPPEWQWSYLFQNTLSRVYLPSIVIVVLCSFFLWLEKQQNFSKKKRVLLFVSSTILFFCFQLSVLYFSRSGVGVLIHRIIDPTINGYFSAALTIDSVPAFLNHYDNLMLHFVYHAKAHPPGAILLFYYLNQAMKPFPLLADWVGNYKPTHTDISSFWHILNKNQKATVFFSACVIPFLSTLSLLPLYYTAKLLYGLKTAIRSMFLFIFIPSLSFFIPINDAFLHIFSITAFCSFLYGLKKQKQWALMLSGSILFLGIMFNLSLLPILILFFIYFFIHEHKILRENRGRFIRNGLIFTSGLGVPFILLFLFFDFNFLTMTQTIMKHVPDVHSRSYLLWIFYNLYDFFVFAGLPIFFSYTLLWKLSIRQFYKKQWNAIDPLFIAFTLMLLIVNFSGSVRGETGRIWIPYIPFLVLLASKTLTKDMNISTKQFLIVLVLQVLQILVMQEFWVMLW